MSAAGSGEPHKTTANRDRAEHRRAVARAVRSERERLTSTTGTRPAFDQELILTYARNRLSATYALPLLVLTVAATGVTWIDPPRVIAWAIVVLALQGVGIWLAGKLVADPATAAATGVWTRRFTLIEAISGLAWAAMLTMVPAYDDSGSGLEIFQLATMLVIVSVTTMLSSTLPAAAVAGTVPVTLTLAAIYLSHRQFLFIALAAMAIGTQVFFLILASRLHKATLTTFEYRAEKDLLIAELETAKAISDESRRRAEEANLAKSRFLATMSHELRTPLNAILGFSEVMKTELLGPIENDNYRDYAASIHDSGSHLLHLINEILDLSRIEAGRYDLHEGPVRLSDVADDCHRLLRLRAEAKALELTEVFARGLPLIWADERAMRQICLNLLSNALKFTPRGGRVTLTVAETEDGGQMLSVRDTGPGIPADEIPKVMQAFGQGSLAHETAEGGTGLGLPIVKNLVELHGGEFELTSELRKGTLAVVRLPKARVLSSLAPLQPLGQERHKQPQGVATPRSNRPSRLRSARPAPPTGATRAETG
jgi:two-component system cell cycle sensor histidine kinase PleC